MASIENFLTFVVEESKNIHKSQMMSNFQIMELINYPDQMGAIVDSEAKRI